MKMLSKTLVLSALMGLLMLAPKARADVDIDLDTYAAVAYSTSTGQYGYAWNYGSRGAAEQAALARCNANDAEIVGWVRGGWLVLVIGDNNAYGVAWAYGEGATNTDALRRAMAQCRKRAEKVTTIVCLCSGNYPPEILK